MDIRRPKFERLFSLGWNEDGCFFGANDAYVQYPGSSSERYLIARCEAMERGLSCALSAGTASTDTYLGDDDHDTAAASESLAESIKLHESPRSVSEEDFYIRPSTASSMLSLPDDLRRHVAGGGLNIIGQDALACLPIAIENKACRLARLLSDLVEEDTHP